MQYQLPPNTALKEFRPVVEQGDKTTQDDLGFKVPRDQSVSQAFQEPSRWLRLPGDQALAVAQGTRWRAANREPDPKGDRRPDPKADEEAVQANVDKAERVIANMPRDVIDEVLEENAEEFVRNFVQTPGK